MSPRFCTLWSLKMALIQSADLISIGSKLRIAGFAVPVPGEGKIEKITTDSGLCSGKGKVVNGLLIGTPTDKEAMSCYDVRQAILSVAALLAR
jgi:hypothetical protein